MPILLVPFASGARLAFSKGSGIRGEVALGSSVALGINIVHNNYEFVVLTYNVLALLMVNIGLIAAVLRKPTSAPVGARTGGRGQAAPDPEPAMVSAAAGPRGASFGYGPAPTARQNT